MSADYLDPARCPAERPSRARMAVATRELHDALDANAPWLHPERRTIQRDLGSSSSGIAWQEAKTGFVQRGDGAWSELPHLYARYGTEGTTALIAKLRELEGARCAFVADCGMQAIALVADALLGHASHAVVMRQVYNKTRALFEHVAKRTGGSLTLVDDGDLAGVAAAITPATKLVFAEAITNPLGRVQDVPALARACGAVPLVLDTTIATPWGFRTRPLAAGARIVVASMTKAIGGCDLALGGYLATDDAAIGNAVMDVIAMRGGILDDDRARRVLAGLPQAEYAHARRCATAAKVAAFLASHPRVERVFHPSRPDHPDAAIIARDLVRTGSLLAFRVRGADEDAHRRLADALASCRVARYALSFDGLATKINHHKTVSEYFTPAEQVARLGIDRLIRLGVGIEDADDLIACLNWALHHGAS